MKAFIGSIAEAHDCLLHTGAYTERIGNFLTNFMG